MYSSLEVHVTVSCTEGQAKLIKKEENMILEAAKADHMAVCVKAREKDKPLPKDSWNNFSKRTCRLNTAMLLTNLWPLARKYNLALADEKLAGGANKNPRTEITALVGKQKNWV